MGRRFQERGINTLPKEIFSSIFNHFNSLSIQYIGVSNILCINSANYSRNDINNLLLYGN